MDDKIVVDLNTGFIDWELIKSMMKENDKNDKKDKISLECKKCNVIFQSRNYIGNKPLCKECRNTTFIINK